MKIKVIEAVKKVLKENRETINFLLMWIGVSLYFLIILLAQVYDINRKTEMKIQIAALEAKTEMYASEISGLEEEVGWLRSIVDQGVRYEQPE